MDYLWTPWRYRYISEAARESACIFCRALALGDDAQALILLRGRKNFVILNRFPYTSGHCMIVPFAHVPDLAGCDLDTLAETMELTRRVQVVLEGLYHPQGYNLGMNLGRAAGAGVADHVHLHILPRWFGDTNFMTTVGESRLEPEELAVTYGKLRGALAAALP
ncbi:MAG TPA: HIT domain-containing protein [Patescibacteria group bacterium]|nr:HIT domain-containing protein [Patescibacteria group bacterium]